jgi:hypothetical protein
MTYRFYITALLTALTVAATAHAGRAQPMCTTMTCAQIAEAAARQAFADCRGGGGWRPVCVEKALTAGAIPPYAHPCNAPPSAPRDYLDRCTDDSPAAGYSSPVTPAEAEARQAQTYARMQCSSGG